MRFKSILKPTVATMLCTSMLLTGTACSSKNTFSEGTTSTKDKGETSSNDSAGKSDVTLTAFVQQSVTTDSGEWKGWGAKKLYDDTKIKLDFYPTGNEVEQKLNQYLASGSLPDIIGFKGLDQAQLAMDANMLLPLNEYQDLMPNIFGNEVYEDAINYSMKYTSNNSNNLYIMPTGVGPASYNSYNWVPLLQWDVYKKVGMPEVNTLEDYLDVVELMVKEKPVNENGEKVYGFSLFSDWDKYTALEVATLSFFYGIDTEYVSHLMETNVMTKEINSILEEDSFYKRALKFYFEANQRGLMDPDSMTQTFSNVDSKYSAGRIMFSHFSWMTGSYNSATSGHVNNPEKPDGYATVLAKDMKLYEEPDKTIGRNWYFAISKDCKEPERAVEFLDWFYDAENIEVLTNGPEGSIWEFDTNGEPYIIDPAGWEVVDKKTEAIMPVEGGGSLQDGMYPFNTPGLSASILNDKTGYTISYRYWPTTVKRNPSLMKQEVNEYYGTETLAEYVAKNDMLAKSTQAVNMIPPISPELEMTVAQIGEIIKKYSWQMIYAKDAAEFESLWGKMVTESQGLGMDKVVEFYTNAWADALNKIKEFE